MATITKTLGIATAYGFAKSKGYAGTEEEFAQEMAGLAAISAEAETLEPDDEATASYSGGVLSFGIPKGDKGDTGETGATGATGNGIASIAKTGTSGLVDTYTITFTDGTTTTLDVTNGAEAIDNTLSIAGRAADAKATGDAVNDLKSDKLNAYTNVDFSIANKRVAPNGQIVGHDNFYVTDYYPCASGTKVNWYGNSFIYQGAPAMCLIAFYDTNKTFISGITTIDGETSNRIGGVSAVAPANTSYVVGGTNGLVSGKAFLHVFDVEQTVKNKLTDISEDFENYKEETGFIIPKITGWTAGKYVSRTDGTEQSNASYHVTDFIAINPKLGNIVLTSANAGNYDTNYNVWYDENKEFISNFSYARNGEMTVTPPSNARYFRLSCNKTVVLTLTVPYADKTLVDMLPENTETGNYVITSALRKENLIVEKLAGTLTYSQSFCMFDGKYYSTNGTNISEQDTSFTELRNAVVNVGHGNALQLGHNGKAYASGWNDNKVYIVDLATLTVENTITLQTTGYTTCAIDDLNSIAYIFQRDSYPDNESPYTFIAYDYANGQTLYTRKTAPFAAMQACDLFNDTIIVVNGLGTTVAPNYCKVYDINGVVTGQYILPDIMRTGEPEGVFFDRNTCDIYVSKESRDIYKISH